MIRIMLDEDIAELSTPIVTFQIVNEEGIGMLPETLSLTLFDRETKTIINERSEQDVLNTNGITIDENGNVEWVMMANDNPIIDDTKNVETHVMQFNWSWSNSMKNESAEIWINVINLAIVGTEEENP